MRIAIIGGTGYVGLTTAVCLATRGHLVFCVGRNKEKIEKIRMGLPVIYEERLEGMLKDIIATGKLTPTTDLRTCVQKSDISFICVGTPSREDGSIDLTQIENAAKELGVVLNEKRDYHVIVVKSTVIPGTTEEVVIPTVEKFSGKRVGVDFGVCMNPEFLREGRAIEDFLFPKEQGIVIGELDSRSGDVLFQVYLGFEAEILRTSIRTAEMIKYARNSYLAKDISFANEIANICQKLGVDYLEVKKGMELDTRIGKGRFLDAGAGFGGSCFPKDVKALSVKAQSVGVSPRILEATMVVNDEQPHEIVEMLEELVGELNGKKIAILGLAFKPGTDDVREAPSIKIIKTLLSKGATVSAYDPKALVNARKILGDSVSLKNTAEAAIKDSDACAIVTDWEEFANPSLYDSLKGRVIVDGRRILDPSKLRSGFVYYAIGMPEIK